MTHRTIVVTRHPALVDLLVERGLIDRDTPVVSHVTASDVDGIHVIVDDGLSMNLQILADRVTEIPLALTAEDRAAGALGLDRLREIAGAPLTTQTKLVCFDGGPLRLWAPAVDADSGNTHRLFNPVDHMLDTMFHPDPDM